MKEKLLLVGSGGFGRVVLEHAQINYDYSFVDEGYEAATKIDGAEVVGKISALTRLFGDYRKLVVVIGIKLCMKRCIKKRRHWVCPEICLKVLTVFVFELLFFVRYDNIMYYGR